MHPITSLEEVEEANRPTRAIGFRDLVLFYIVSGISLRWIATAAAAGPSSIVIWVAAWLMFYTPLALSVIELSSRYPNEGGLYVWSKRAYGDFAGFISAWIYWTSNLPYFPAILYFAASNVLYMRPEKWGYLSANPWFFIGFALITLALATLLNIVGLNAGKWLNNVGAFGMWIPVAMIMVMGAMAYHRFGPATHFTLTTMMPNMNFKDVLFWSVLIYAFGGCETASFMGDEIKNPRHNIPRALFSAGLLVVICYILGTVAVLVALPSSQVNDLQGLMQAISAASGRLGFAWIIPIAAALIAISNIGASGAFLAATARLPFVAGIDKFLPSAFGRVHPQWKTPWVAILTQAVCGAIFIFLGQAGTTVKAAYDILVAVGGITYMLPYLFVFASMFKLQREPAGPDVMRVPGGKPVALLLAVVGFATTSVATVLFMIPSPEEPHKVLAVVKIVGMTGLLLAIGVGLYWSGRRRAKQPATV